ncbi:response regulator [Adhaeribacter aerolatus]|uniref:Response regulator n=2 Tax=Adhaeribacter aerolatus TaxID=670289 RepID=A0A512AXQ9_9BACT|nr:response regulator [Adhaeribacter aerolatus]
MLKMQKAVDEVITFYEAKEALVAIQAGLEQNDLPSLILLDLNMPLMDGWEFLEALTPLEEKLKDKVQIFILTSSVDPADEKKSQTYSLVSGFIPKPLSAESVNLMMQQLNVNPADSDTTKV